MTGNPAHDQAILDFIARINKNHGGCTARMAWTFIQHLGYDDPGRELRRLYEAGKLQRDTRNGEYYARKTMYAQGLGKWI